MSMLGDALIRLMADAAKAGAQAAAQQHPRRKGAGGASSCTPCAAHAFVDKIKSQAGMTKKR